MCTHRFRLFIAAIALLFSLNAQALTEVSLQLKWYPQWQFSGYYVAQAKGFYLEEGLKVDIRSGGPGISPAEEVSSGRADFGVGSSHLVIDRVKGQPVVAMTAILQQTPAAFMTLMESDLKKPEDFAGKRVMLMKGSSSFELLATLQKAGVLDQIERVDSSFVPASLLNGQADVFNAYISNEPYVFEQQGVPYNLITPASEGLQFYSDVLFADQSEVESRLEVVKAFERASLKGWKYALENLSESIDIVHRIAPEKSKAHLRFEAVSLSSHMANSLLPLGYMSEERWDSILSSLKSIGLAQADASISYDKFLFESYKQEFNWAHYWPQVSAVVLFFVVLSFMLFVAHNRSLHAEQRLAQSYFNASHDRMTKLLNRPAFEERLEIVLGKMTRLKITPLLLFADIDNFKAINDHYGHASGDKFLVAIAEAFNASTRDTDVVARWGGDEFVFLFEDIASRDENEVIDRLVKAVNDQVKEQGLAPLNIAISLGGIRLDVPEGLSKYTILNEADRRMYEAKRVKGVAHKIVNASKLTIKAASNMTLRSV